MARIYAEIVSCLELYAVNLRLYSNILKIEHLNDKQLALIASNYQCFPIANNRSPVECLTLRINTTFAYHAYCFYLKWNR